MKNQSGFGFYFSLAVVSSIAIFNSPILASADELPSVKHWDLQAVNNDGTSAWQGTLPFVIEGVIINNPEEMLDFTPNFVPYNDGAGLGIMGGQWQIFIQAVAPDDRGGTALWMGQNYGNLAFKRNTDLSYTDEEWIAEMNRVNFDSKTGHKFRAGDLVRVTARRSLFYGGKRNINEAHSKDPDANFDIELIAPDYGLPTPEVISLADLVRQDDADPSTSEYIFDPTRQTGCEHWQGMLVRINNLSWANTNNWSHTNSNDFSQRTCIVTDGNNRFFPVVLPLKDLGPIPTTNFDLVGILNQESGSGTQGTNGYQLFLTAIYEHQQSPKLVIGTTQNQNILIKWQQADGWILEKADSLSLLNVWTPVAGNFITNQGFVSIEIPATSSSSFFRLKKD